MKFLITNNGWKETLLMQWLLSQDVDSPTWVQILNEVVCISHSTNTLGKAMNLTILLSTMDKYIVEYAEFFNLDKTTCLGEGKLWIQNSCRPRKNELHQTISVQDMLYEKYPHDQSRLRGQWKRMVENNEEENFG